MTKAVCAASSSAPGQRENGNRAQAQRCRAVRGCVRPRTVSLGVGHVDLSPSQRHAGGEPARRNVAQHPPLPTSITPTALIPLPPPATARRLRGMPCRPAARRAALQARNAHGDLAATRLVRASITVMESLFALETNTRPRWPPRPTGCFRRRRIPEGNAGTDERFHLRRGGFGDVHHAQGVRFTRVRIAQPGHIHRAARGGAAARRASALGNPNAGNGRPVSRASRVGAGNRAVLEHSHVGDVQLPPVGRKRQRKRQPPHGNRGNCLAGTGFDHHYAEVRLIRGVDSMGASSMISRGGSLGRFFGQHDGR